MGTSEPSVVDTKVSQSAGSKASLADVGLMVPSHERGFQKVAELVKFVAKSLVFSSGRLCGGRGSVTSLVPMRARTAACWVVFGLMLTAGVGPSAAFHGPAALRAPGAPPNFPPLPFIFLLPILFA
jgi:hypothetical protein